MKFSRVQRGGTDPAHRLRSGLRSVIIGRSTRDLGGRALVIVGLALFGYAVALPIYLWHRRDLRMFHRPLWAGYGSRSARLRGATVCYVAAGWPEILMALGWRTSQTRRALLAERENFREGQPTGGSGRS